ncbi:Uncharacterised protein [Vibrio cholerae]|nr:Uncharacterised protein [Vibrio cholerae]
MLAYVCLNKIHHICSALLSTTELSSHGYLCYLLKLKEHWWVHFLITQIRLCSL